MINFQESLSEIRLRCSAEKKIRYYVAWICGLMFGLELRLNLAIINLTPT